MKQIAKEQKKETNAQLQRRLKNAVLHIDKTKDTKSVFLSDTGLRLVVNEDYAVIETNFHRHVFSKITASGYSRPYLYAMQVLDIALNNDCMTADGYSWGKLLNVLEAKENKTEYNICWFFDKWLFNIFSPLYELDETEASAFFVYERFLHNVARNKLLLEEHKKDVTNKQFFNTMFEEEKAFIENMKEAVILQAKSDEQRIKEELDALKKDNEESIMEEQANGEQQE